jgi:GNAT superfamily N-acetyltransferase
MDWMIRKANLEDKDAILGLLKESFSGFWSAKEDIYSPEFWNWLYRDNPGGGSITFVAENKGRVIGHFPNVLERLKVNAGLYRTGMVLHLTTHSDYRRKGIFKNLGEAALEELNRSKIPYSRAFPNDASRPGFINKLGFSPIATLPLLIKPLRIRNILTAVVKKPILAKLASIACCPLYHFFFYHYKLKKRTNGIKVEQIERFGPEFDNFWKKAMAQAKVMVERNAKFLSWRFNQRPGENYHTLAALRNKEIIGYIVTRKADISSLNTGIIMDYLVLPGEADALRSLLNSALDYFTKEGIDICITSCLKNNIYYNILEEEGFIKVPSKLNPRKLVLVGRVNQDDADKNIFLDRKNWFVTFGDWDVF